MAFCGSQRLRPRGGALGFSALRGLGFGVLGFWGLGLRGFGVQGGGFWCLELGFWGFGFRFVQGFGGVGCRVWNSGCRVTTHSSAFPIGKADQLGVNERALRGRQKEGI